MLFEPSYERPLVPGQRCLVFPYPDASGATLGWYGEIISGHCRVGYRVLWEGREIFVRPRDLLGIDEFAGPTTEESAYVWLHLDSAPSDDQWEISGHYAAQCRDWALFRFAKYDGLTPRYEFRLPGRPVSTTVPVLEYQVPSAWRLDLPFVLRIFKRLIGKARLYDFPLDRAG